MIEPGVILNNRYRVLRSIGEGGMGAVYEGEHTGVGRKVAIKVLHPQYADNQELVDRFEREARAAAAIGHDNIIDILDVGSHDGSPFMIMEYLKGDSLGGRLEKVGKLGVASAVHIMKQVLSALAAAHKVTIVHRDLKPDNVFLVQKAGVTDFVKLLDFGISKFRSEEASSGKALTQAGALMGTPYYMAPEQALAKKDIDHRADIYSAGVMLYEMVTGRLPFEADSQTELLLAIVHGSEGFKPPSEFNPDLPGEFEAVILKAMDRDRDKRFADCAEFAAALAPYADESAMPAPDRSLRTRPVSSTAAHKAITPLGWETNKPADATKTPAPTAVAEPAPASSRARGGIIAIAGATAVLAVVGVLALRHPSTPTPSSVVPQAASTGPTANTASNHGAQGSTGTGAGSPTTAAHVERVSVDLEGLPVGAVITVDGVNSMTAHLQFDRGSTHQLRVTAPGMQPFESTLRAERDRSVAVAMQPAQAAAATTPAAVATTPTSTGHASTEGRTGAEGHGSHSSHGHAAAASTGGSGGSGGSGSGGNSGAESGGGGRGGPPHMQVDTTY